MVYKTHASMIREAIEKLKVAKPPEIMNFIHEKYPEVEIKKNSFSADIIGCSVNHSSSHHYLGNPKFLFYEKGNKTYQLYDPEKHGIWIVDGKGARSTDQIENEVEGEMIANETVLGLEKDLEDYIIRNLDQIETGLKIYKEDNRNGRQFNTNIGIIDVLSVNKNNDFVVIELKVGTATYSAIGQILGYISEVRQNIAKGRQVRGIIIADEFDKKIIAAVSEIPHVSLKKYRVNFTFENV